jgi:YVTN family beta-propeller protein
MKSCLPLFLIATSLLAAPTPPNAILVLEKEQNTLVIVDPANLTIVARVPAGSNPHEVAVSDDGKIAYISNYSGNNTISRVDLVAQKPLTPIDLGAMRSPHGLEFVGGKLFFTAEDAKVVGHYDPATDKIDWILGTGQDRTHMVIATKDLKTVLTSNVSSGTISVITQVPPGRGAGAPGWEVTNIPVGHGSEGFDLTPDGKELWVANAQDKTISVIDLAAKKVVATLPSTSNANRLKITLDGKYAFASDLGGTEMLIIDVATRKPFKTMKMGASCEGLLMAPDGQHVYTTLNDHDSVAVIDLKTFTVTGEVKTGRGPDGLAWASRK